MSLVQIKEKHFPEARKAERELRKAQIAAVEHTKAVNEANTAFEKRIAKFTK